MAEDDPLSWLLELDAKLDGAHDMLEALKADEAALKSLDGAFKKTEQATKRSSDEHKKHAHEIKTTAEEVKHLRERLNDLTLFQVGEWGFDKALDIAGELLEKVIEIGAEAIKVAAHEERVASSFKLQLGAEEGEHMLKYLDRVGTKTEFVGSELKNMTLELVKSGFAAEKIPYALAAVGDLAGFSADKSQGASSALEALTRIQRTGKVMERSLAPFGFGEDALAKTLQTRGQKGSIDSIKQLLQKGQINREEVLQAVYQTITTKTGKALGGVGAELGQGLEARLHRLGALPELYFEKWSESPGFQVFSDRIDALFKKLDPETPEGKQIFAALDGALGELTGVIEKLLTPAGLDAFVSGLKAALGTVGELIHGLQVMIDLITGESLSNFFYGGKNAGDKETAMLAEELKGKYEAAQKQGGNSEVLNATLRNTLANLDPAMLEDVKRIGKEQGIDYSQYMPKKQEGFKVNSYADYNAGGDVLDGVPKYAAGGIVNKPTLALVGEAGPEAIVPLGDDFNVPTGGGGDSGGAGAMGGRNVTLTVPIYVTVQGTEGDGADAIAARIKEIVPTAMQSAIDQLRAELGV